MRIERLSAGDLDRYERIPIGFEIRSRLNLEALISSGGKKLRELPCEPRWKDYDVYPDERPTAHRRHYDLSPWLILGAVVDDRLVGGCLVARDTPNFEMLEGRTDLALLVDIRVLPECRQTGVGSLILTRAVDLARGDGCSEMIVETQDVNVGACRFYARHGFRLQSVDRLGYGPEIDEARLIWRREL